MHDKKLSMGCLLLLCTLFTQAASNTFPQSLMTHHSIPVTMGTVVGYIMGNQLDQNPFGPISLTCAAMGTLAGAKLDSFLSKNKAIPLVVTGDKINLTKMYCATAHQKQQSVRIYPPRQQHVSEFEALKEALYKTKGARFKYWFEMRYNSRYPTKEAAWALYWQISDKILHITDQGGRLRAKVSVGECHIMLTDVLWQEMLSIKSRILKHECQSSSLQK